MKEFITLACSLAKEKFRNLDSAETSVSHIPKNIDVNNKDKKTYIKKLNIKIRLRLKTLRNFVANSSIINRYYLLGWIAFFIDSLLRLIEKAPIIACTVLFLTIFLFIIKNKNLVLDGVKEIYNWINFFKILRIFLSLFSFILIIKYYKYYVLFLSRYSNHLYYDFLINYYHEFNLINFSCIVFITCFVIEGFLFWKEKEKIFKPFLSLVAAVSSFVSVSLSRWVIIYCVGIEPELFSTSSILFSVVFGILIWIFVSIAVLLSIYFLTLFWGVIFASFSFFVFDFANLKNTLFWRFLFRTSLEESAKKNTQRMFYELFLYKGGRAVGAGLLAFLIYTLTLVSISILIFKIPLIYRVEQIIVYADYRPSNKVTECSNLKKEEWGLLLKNKKINVATPQALGGYSFETRSCILDK
jgi:hypothetical protein